MDRSIIYRLLRSIGAAANGLVHVLVSQSNFRIQLAAAIVVFVIAGTLGVSLLEWAVLVVVIAMVLAMEVMNTALELLADHVQPEHDPLIGRAKDVAAGAVLLAAILAAIVGLLVFGSYLF